MYADPSRERDPRGAGDGRAGRATPIAIHQHGATTPITYSYEARTPDPKWLVDHDRAQGVFRLTGPDGRIACFRDRALRYLVLEPDPETGDLRPQIRAGQPTILRLCREEREVP